MFLYGSPNHLSVPEVPCRHHDIKVYYPSLRTYMYNLYRYHFPITSFGKWTSSPRPFENFSNEQLDDAIAAELANAGIEPSAFVGEYPRRITDKKFLVACYHLLNNVLLYFPKPLTQGCRSVVQKWRSESDYDLGHFDVNEIVDGNERGGYPGYAVVGYYKESRIENFDRFFTASTSSRVHGMDYSGSWKGRYTTSIIKDLDYPRYEGYNSIYESISIPGVKEIDFSGNKTDFIPWLDETVRDLEYYKTWGSYKYLYTSVYQDDRLTEILIDKNNMPELKYQYLD